ncbi:MAG: DNA translocase FtsK [Candidatus Pacebacteria bacterium]|nr:DNA translocase FtsK [Candidatus Paceibacterota bacterium]
MAKKNKESGSRKETHHRETKQSNMSLNLKEETKHAVLAVIMLFLALFFVLSLFGGAGVAGAFFHTLFGKLFGVGYFLIPVIFILLGISFIKSVRPNITLSHSLSSVLFLCASLGIVTIASGGSGGGIIGNAVAYPFVRLFDVYAAILLLGALLIISLFVMFDARPELMPIIRAFLSLFKKKPISAETPLGTYQYEEEIVEEEIPAPMTTQEEEKPKKEKKKKEEPITDEEVMEMPKRAAHAGSYTPPPLSLLEDDRGKPNVGDIKANSNIIKRTLANFGILVEMDEITIGPTVTRYALKPAEGVKISRIIGLQNDLALALAAHPLRIEAPIPGKSLVGIEIPNKMKSTVGLASLLGEKEFQTAPKPLLMALGKDIAGKPLIASLAKMPHVLIAGTTGSGKSITIHALITSLLYRNGPEDLKFIMVDPKRVEMTAYNKAPHLLTPVITEPKKAILALKWAAKEMERRYSILEEEGVRDIASYHERLTKGGATKKVKKEDGTTVEEGKERMPYIVVIIDELADIMTAYPRELETGIVRLAQMSRAVGIHLIISTQRPSVNVITGLIKANVPARIALQVSSQIDSRTILDDSGAEKLLGAGDMLYLSGDMPQPKRVQSAFISEDEVRKVVKYLADSYRDEIMDEINLTGTISHDKSIFESTLDDDGGDDDLYEEARQTVIEAGKASTSFLQRKLKVGYARAARLVDMLEERGVVGPGDGAKPREVLEKSVAIESQDYQ